MRSKPLAANIFFPVGGGSYALNLGSLLLDQNEDSVIGVRMYIYGSTIEGRCWLQVHSEGHAQFGHEFLGN